MTIARLARPEVRALRPYEAAQQVEGSIRLNANEAPWPCGGDNFQRPLNRYPEVRPAALRIALARHFGCDSGRLLVTRGSSEAIDLLIRTFCRADRDNIVTTHPGFSMYGHYATLQGAGVRRLETRPDDDFAIDVDALLDTCDASTRLIFVCSPNNPTGTTLSRDSLVELLQRRGDRSAIVIDEAYIEFSGQASAAELLGRYENLLVLRTLSKALAFAGARCGAVMGPPEVIRLLDAVQAPYALSTPVIECVEQAMQPDRLEEAAQRIAAIVGERQRLMAAVAAFTGVEKVWPSAANFFLTRVRDCDAFLGQCRRNGVLVRHFSDSPSGCIRITIGSPEENERLLQVFREHERLQR